MKLRGTQNVESKEFIIQLKSNSQKEYFTSPKEYEIARNSKCRIKRINYLAHKTTFKKIVSVYLWL